MLPANAKNIDRVFRYLNRFTPESLWENRDTNILLAIKTALSFEPTVVVLITDGLPVGDDDNETVYIETSTQEDS